MDENLRGVIHDMTLRARALLMTEARELLEGTYGLDVSGNLAPADRLPALRDDPEAQETRRRLEQFLEDEAKAGLRGRQAVEKLTKEVAFTHLNRFVAFKMLEARKLTRQTLARGTESNAFKFYLVEHPEEEERWKAGDVDTVYRHFLLWQCAQMAKELKVLFDPHNLASHLFPRPRTLRELIEMLNAAELQEAWAPGNEETIGWVYQGFNAEELEKAFREARLLKKKFEAQDIPAVTQLFTPRWIVRYLVENTLGRLWISMHPDSTLADKLEYLVPFQSSPTALTKPASEIRLLDPACGTMHFGLVAFDLFIEMYREELEHAGQPGWPDEPSVAKEEDIPAAIIRNNIYGIDIDLRAVQLAALTLYLKAKTFNPKVQLDESRLACADIHMLDGNRLQTFLSESGITRPIYNRILTELQDRLKDAEQLGSLLRLDDEIHALVEQERYRYEREGREPDLFGWSSEQFESEAGRREFWGILEMQIGQALDAFARHQAEQGQDQSFFVGETTKGLRLLEVMANRYDIVVTNPPYMSQRKMNDMLKKLVVDAFPNGKGDLYAAFIQRCLELATDGGYVGMLTMHSFMFISSYERLRQWIRNRAIIESLAHTGPGLFDVGNPGTLQTAAYILHREAEEELRQCAVGTYFRLVKEPNAETKQRRFETALDRLRDSEDGLVVYRYRQADFDAIPGSPWVYWITPGLRWLFEKLPKLKNIAQPRQGMATGHNFRFLRFWWEVGKQRVGFGCTSQDECQARPEKWFPYMKGGSFCSWYGNQEYCINYGRNGYEIKAWADPLYGNSGWSRIIKSPDFYFRRGVTWTDLTSGRFSARLSPGGFIFDVSGSSVFPDDASLVLAVMNSRFAQYALKLINPTVHVQVGDLARLPIPPTSSHILQALVQQGIALTRADSEEDEVTYDFIAPLCEGSLDETLYSLRLRAEKLAKVERQIDEEVYQLYGISEEDRVAIEIELAAPVVTRDEGEDDEDKAAAGSEEGMTEDALLGRESLALRWIDYAVGIVMGRFQPGVEGALGHGRFPAELAGKLREISDDDDIAVLDSGHQDDLAAKVEQVLELMLGETGAVEVTHTALGNSRDPAALLRLYLERDFFKQHIQQYRKRPIYWLLQSPKKHYSVYLYYERVSRDTLPLIRGNRYLGGKINQTRHRIEEVQTAIKTAEGRKKRQLEKDLDNLQTLPADLEAFDQAIQRVLNAQNERGETVGWRPEIDDGVILNLAPLHEILPSWKAEPKKYWEGLEDGEYDWSYTAMRYWPKRVLEKCRKNKSYAIAHNCLDLYEGDRK